MTIEPAPDAASRKSSRRLSRRSSSLLDRFTAPRRSRAFWITAWLAVGLCEFATLAPTLFQGSGQQPVTLLFHLLGGSFAACGLIAWRRRPDNLSGPWMIATGAGFFVSPVVGLVPWAPAQAVAGLMPDLWILFFVPLVLTFPTAGRLRHTVDRLLVAVIAVEIVVLNPLYLLFHDDAENVLLVHPDEAIAATVDTVQRSVLILVTVTTVVLIASRYRAASGPARRAMLPSVGGTLSLGLFAMLLGVDLVLDTEREPVVSQVLLWLAVVSILVVPLAFLAGLLRSRLARGGLAELFRGLGTMQPRELRDALARALGDPQLVIAYPAGDGSSWVDSDGRAVELPTADSERSVTAVHRDGTRVAVLVYDSSLDDDPELVEAVGGAATVALENRQLHAEADARLAELHASRARVIAAGDEERRRIERNLHDGAQQGLVTLALQLSLIRRQIRADPAGAEASMTSATDELARSLAELRELARGIHPAVLDQGLDVALDTLAMRSAVPTTVVVDPGPPLPEPVAFAVYLVASEALANIAKYAHASAATVQVARTGTSTVVRISDDGVGGADPAAGTGLRGLADRVESLGGRLTVVSAKGSGTTLAAEVPDRNGAG